MIRCRAIQFRKHVGGASAVEFALMVPVFITMVMALIEFSMILFTYNTAGYATRDVARRIATNRLAASAASSTLKLELPQWVRNAATVNVAQSTPANVATNQITVSVTFPAWAATPTTFLRAVYQNTVVTSATTIQQEAAL